MVVTTGEVECVTVDGIEGRHPIPRNGPHRTGMLAGNARAGPSPITNWSMGAKILGSTKRYR